MVEGKRKEGEISTVLVHPERLQIVLALKKNPTYVSNLSRELGMNRGLLVYHLKILEAHGYLNGAHEIPDEGGAKGRAVHKFQVTEKAKERIGALTEVLKTA